MYEATVKMFAFGVTPGLFVTLRGNNNKSSEIQTVSRYWMYGEDSKVVHTVLSEQVDYGNERARLAKQARYKIRILYYLRYCYSDYLTRDRIGSKSRSI